MNAVVKRRLSWAVALILMMAIMAVAAACNRAEEQPIAPDPDPVVTPAPAPVETPPPAAEVEVDLDFEVEAAVDALAGLRELEAQFPRAVVNNNPIIQGGDFHWMLPMTQVIPGLFHPHLSTLVTDSDIRNFFIYTLVASGDDGRIIVGPYGHNAPAYFDFCLDSQTATFTMMDGVYIYWQDGVPLTMDDLKYAFEFISHPDYTGVRFGPSNGTSLVVGVDEFRSGDADYISGLVLSEDKRQLTVHFTEMPPGLMFEIVAIPIPRHHFEGIPVADTAGHLNARDNLIGFGPFLIETVVAGEAVVLRANENYWRGRPYMDRIVFTRVDPEFGAEGARIGQADRVGFRLLDWPYHQDMNNMQFLGRIGNGLGPLIYFTLGEMRVDDYGDRYIVARDDGHPITNPALRRAMAYAVDRLAIDVNFNQGFGRPASSILSPFNAEQWICPYSPGLSIFDLDRANELLDEAGFTMGPDGFRLCPDGNPFYINYGMPHSASNEVIFPMHQQNFAEIGLDVRLFGDAWYSADWAAEYRRSVFNNPAYTAPRSRNSDLHMFQSSWALGTNPSPLALWGNNQAFNFARFTTPEWQQVLDNINSQDAWCPEFMGENMRAYAALFDRYVPAITASWSVTLTIVNNRVANFSLQRGAHLDDSMTGNWHRVGLTADAPYAHQ